MKTKWANIEKAKFLERLGLCLIQGYPLIVAIEMLAYQEKDSIQMKLQDMLGDLKKGESLYEVFLRNQFPADICGFVYFSERHGDVAMGLSEAGKILSQREASKQKVQQLLKYPLLLLWFIFVMFYIMLKFLYPQFQSLYASMDIKLPWVTRLLLSLQHHIGQMLIPFILFICIFFVIFFILLRRASIFTLLNLVIKIPLVSSIIRLYLTYYLSLQLGSLLKVGMSINAAFQVMSEQSFLPFFSHEALYVMKKLKQGNPLEQVFRHRSYYTVEFSHIIAHGQMNGLLGNELFDYSQLIISDLKKKLDRVFALIQPLLLVGIGGFTLLLFLSILLPIFQMLNGF